jgi:hypothetical protein
VRLSVQRTDILSDTGCNERLIGFALGIATSQDAAAAATMSRIIFAE